jgi:hypothetical protein
MGSNDQFALQKSSSAHVCFGSKADIEARPFDVRFTPESGHCSAQPPCPLCAISGHCGPWSVEELDACFVIKDQAGKSYIAEGLAPRSLP